MVKVKVVLLDPNEALVFQSTMTFESEGLKFVALPNQDGEFQVQLPFGVYRLSVESKGFKRYEVQAFEVKQSGTEDLTIRLDVEQDKGQHLYFPDIERIEAMKAPAAKKMGPRKIK